LENFHNKHELDSIEIEQFNKLYNSNSTPSIFQNFAFNKINNEKKHYFFVTENNVITSYLIVIESNLSKLKSIKTAKIISEPVAINELQKEKLINYILKYYIKFKFSDVNFTPLNSKLNFNEFKKYNIKFQSRETGTILIDLNYKTEEIISNFSKNLKKNINKGKNKGITTRLIEKDDEISILVDIHSKMSIYKNINHYSKDEIRNILRFIWQNKQGFIMGCFLENSLIGGIACLNQGTRTEYFIGISHPEFRKLPINHLGIYESILYAKNKNQIEFDMGGIVLNAKEDDQLYSIGEFKKDFSKKTIKFNPENIIITNKTRYIIKNCYLIFTKLLNK
jgi:hypothetical protein